MVQGVGCCVLIEGLQLVCKGFIDSRQPGDFHVMCCQPQHLDVCSTDNRNSSASCSQLKTLKEFREEKFKTKQFKTKHLRFLNFGF